MIQELKKQTTLSAIALIGLFTFIFLGGEYLYVNMLAMTTQAHSAVMAQNYALGVSTAGFLLYPLLNRRIKQQNQSILNLAWVLAAIVCIFVMQQHLSYTAVLISGMTLFFILGIFGSSVHFMAAQIVKASPALAKTAGMAYALGILLQFLNNNIVNIEIAEAAVLSVFLALLYLLMRRTQQKFLDRAFNPEQESDAQDEDGAMPRKRLTAGLLLALLIALMACVFSTLDNAVTLRHVAGTADIGQFPRILLAVSGLAAGFAFDIKKRKFMNIIMYCVMMLSTICVAAMWMGEAFIVGLVVFYLTAGFFAVFFTTSFMELSLYMRVPELWAGLGRAVNNLSAVLITNFSISMLFSGGNIAAFLIMLFIFAAVMVVMTAYSAQLRAVTQVDDTKRQEEEKFVKFGTEFALTPREQEIFREMLVMPSESVQALSERLSISRTVLYKHIRSLNEKTNTATRLELTQFYYDWEQSKDGKLEA